MTNDGFPPVGHTDDNGNWHWGSSAARLGRLSAEENRRDGEAASKAAQEQAAAHAYTLDQEAQRAEPSPSEIAARALWETVTPAPAIEQNGPQLDRERGR